MVRLSKKGLVLVIILVAVLLGGTGYLFWRVNESNQISPFDADAGTTVESECPDNQCATNGYRWQWKKNLGECKKVADSSCKTPKDDKNTGKCNDNSAEKCKSASPGAACGDGTCVSIRKDSNGVQCSCQGGVPKNPTTPEPTNSCEGGALSSPVSGDSGKVGEEFLISGYAFDADGINKTNVKISVDGVVVGNATATDACPSGNASVCTSVGSTKKPVVWSYSFTPTKESHDIVVTWADSKGATGANCTKSATLSSAPKDVSSADWSVSAAASSISCKSTDGVNSSAVANYTITVTNSGTSEGTLSRVEVVLDDLVEDSYIMTESIDPSATVSAGVITWDLSGGASIFASGQSKTYKFSLDLPKALYGTVSHEVNVLPSGGDADAIEQVLSGTVACTDSGEVPETAIFDSAVGQIAMSLVLISLGYLYLKGYDRGVVNVLGAGVRRVSDSYIGVFGEEARVTRARKRFERKMK